MNVPLCYERMALTYIPEFLHSFLRALIGQPFKQLREEPY